MKTIVHILVPFDLGLELDFQGQDAKEIVKDLSNQPTPPLYFSGRRFDDASLTARIYKFGIGLIDLSFPVEGDLDFLAALSCRTEMLAVGETPIIAWAKTIVDEVLATARGFANHTYDRRLQELDPFPVFVLDRAAVTDATSFMEKNEKALTGIVSGEPNYDALSDFVLEQEKLKNFGYYQNELVLMKRFGALVCSEEAKTILTLVRLTYSLYWSLRSYTFFLEKEIDHAQVVLADLPPYYKFWAMPAHYQAFSRESMDFVRDKLAIVDSLHNVQANIPGIDSDWHLRTLYKNLEKEFDIDELSSSVDTKLERIEQSYNSARDHISTNFFIAVEIVLVLSFLWMVLDTSLLFVIANK